MRRQCLIYQAAFCAAHSLDEKVVGKEHPCTRVHGYSYQLRVEIAGDTNSAGTIVDTDWLKRAIDEDVVQVLDHRSLNEIIDNPTIEYVGKWIFQTLALRFRRDFAVELQQVGGLGWRGES